VLMGHDSAAVTVQYCKKSLFKRTAGDATAMLTKLVGVDTHKTNSAEVRERQTEREGRAALLTDWVCLWCDLVSCVLLSLLLYTLILQGGAPSGLELPGASGPPHLPAARPRLPGLLLALLRLPHCLHAPRLGRRRRHQPLPAPRRPLAVWVSVWGAQPDPDQDGGSPAGPVA
jgi:hypothetical protein